MSMSHFIKTPLTLFQAVQRLMSTMRPEDLATWAEEKEESARATVHDSIGRGIRNEWGLWGNSELARYLESCGLHHPDDMSAVILTCLHREVNNKPWAIEEQVKRIRNYWRSNLDLDEFKKMYGEAP